MRRGGVCGRVLAGLLLAWLLLPVSGCRDYQELEQMLIVTAAAVDVGEKDNELRLTAEVLCAASATGSGTEPTESYTVSADTLPGCERELRKVVRGNLYWGHAEVLFFSRESIETRLAQTIDWVLRDNEARLTVIIAVSGERTAAELFMADTGTVNVGEALRNLLAGGAYPGASEDSAVIRMSEKLKRGEYVLLPLICVENTENLRPSKEYGAASEAMGGMGQEDTQQSSQPSESEPDTTQRLTSDGAVMLRANPLRAAAHISDGDMRLAALAEGKTDKNGYVLEGGSWTLAVEHISAERDGERLKLRGECRIALLSEHKTQQISAEALDGIAREASEMLGEKLRGALGRIAEASGETAPEVSAELTIASTGLISG